MRGREFINCIHRQKGFGLLSSLFVIVAIGGLIVSINQVLTSQSKNVEQAVLLSQAQYAAESGMEWAIYSATSSDSCTGVNGASFNVSAWPEFDIGVTCTQSTYSELGASVSMYELTTTITTRSSYGSFGDANYIFKRISAVVEDV